MPPPTIDNPAAFMEGNFPDFKTNPEEFANRLLNKLFEKVGYRPTNQTMEINRVNNDRYKLIIKTFRFSASEIEKTFRQLGLKCSSKYIVKSRSANIIIDIQ